MHPQRRLVEGVVRAEVARLRRAVQSVGVGCENESVAAVARHQQRGTAAAQHVFGDDHAQAFGREPDLAQRQVLGQRRGEAAAAPVQGVVEAGPRLARRGIV